MSKKPKPQPEYTGPIFPVGSSVKVLRPNLAFDKKAVVILVNPVTGEHLIRVTADNGAEFNGVASGWELEAFDLLA